MHAALGTSFCTALRAGVCQGLQHPHGHDLCRKLPNGNAQPIFKNNNLQPKSVQLMNLSKKSWTQTDSEEYPLEWASEIVLASLEKQGRSLLFIYSCGSCIELSCIELTSKLSTLSYSCYKVVSAGNGKQPNFPDHHESNSLTANESGAATAPSPIENAQHIYNYNTNSPTWNKNAHLPKWMESCRIHALMFFWHLVFAFIH